jgi:hypothetical protein
MPQLWQPTLRMPGGAAWSLHDVFGFDVAVNDADGVGSGQRPRELRRDGHDLADGKRTGLEQHAQRLARHVLARQVEFVADFLQGVHRGDARMRQSRCGSRFEPEAVAAAWFPAEAGRQRLERHASRQPRVVGEIDDAHAAAAQFAPEDVGADNPAFELLRVVPGVCRGFTEVLRLGVEQGRHFGAQPEPALADAVEIRRAFRRIALQHGGVDLPNLPRLVVRSHGWLPCAEDNFFTVPGGGSRAAV